MNIFMLHQEPQIAAQYHCDKHVIKMVLESAQLLCTALNTVHGKQVMPYKSTHINHPCAIWVRESRDNALWLVELTAALNAEYKYRYGKTHKVYSSGLAAALESVPNNMSSNVWTIPPSAMAKEYIVSDDPVTNYRNYYINGKKHLHKWSKRSIPNWMQL